MSNRIYFVDRSDVWLLRSGVVAVSWFRRSGITSEEAWRCCVFVPAMLSIPTTTSSCFEQPQRQRRQASSVVNHQVLRQDEPNMGKRGRRSGAKGMTAADQVAASL